MRRLAICVAVMAVLTTSGCIQYGGGLAPSSLPISARDSVTEIGPTSGSSWAIGLFQFPLWPYDAYTALQKAKKKVGADVLIDIRADNKVYWVILPIYPIITVHSINVKAMGAKYERGGKTR